MRKGDRESVNVFLATEEGARSIETEKITVIREPVCSPRWVPEATDRGGEIRKDILLKDLNKDKSLSWFWGSSPPQLTLHNSLEFSKEETNGCVNKHSFINNSESSFVLPDEEQVKNNTEHT